MGRSAEEIKKDIESGNTALGIEFGSTRIKAVLTDGTTAPIAQGSYEWENRLENGIWTYSLEDIWKGLKDCYADLAADVKNQYGLTLKRVGAMGVSAMMHGYMAFDADGKLLVPFRTWRNTMTAEAARRLTDLFNYNIPQRWSIAHLYQAVINGEEHVSHVHFLTTLAGYVHWKLTGKQVLGVGDASGMFPIDPATGQYDAEMLYKFEEMMVPKGYPWKLRDLLPEVLSAGDEAGTLTEEGAKLLDESGNLEAGIPLCPPEGDAGTGMTATNSVAVRTGNVSAGTSVFAMVVLEKTLETVHQEIDMVTTPDGHLVGMVHCNNCTSDINAWVHLFGEFASAAGLDISDDKLYTLMFNQAGMGDADCGGLISYNCYSGEPVLGLNEGCPMFIHNARSSFNLPNFMRTNIYSALAPLKSGMDILLNEENIELTKITGHGGLFKTPVIGQRMLSAAINTPVCVMSNAGEGGAWGIAVLAAYAEYKKCNNIPLADYLDTHIFNSSQSSTLEPDPADVAGFNTFMNNYKNMLPAEKIAAATI